MLGESFIRRGTDALFGKREKVDPNVKKAREICEGLLSDHAWGSELGHRFLEPVEVDGKLTEVEIFVGGNNPRKARFIHMNIVGEPETARISKRSAEIGVTQLDMHPLEGDELQRHTKILKELRELYPPLPY